MCLAPGDEVPVADRVPGVRLGGGRDRDLDAAVRRRDRGAGPDREVLPAAAVDRDAAEIVTELIRAKRASATEERLPHRNSDKRHDDKQGDRRRGRLRTEREAADPLPTLEAQRCRRRNRKLVERKDDALAEALV